MNAPNLPEVEAAQNRLNIHARLVDYPGGEIGFDRDIRLTRTASATQPSADALGLAGELEKRWANDPITNRKLGSKPTWLHQRDRDIILAALLRQPPQAGVDRDELAQIVREHGDIIVSPMGEGLGWRAANEPYYPWTALKSNAPTVSSEEDR